MALVRNAKAGAKSEYPGIHTHTHTYTHSSVQTTSSPRSGIVDCLLVMKPIVNIVMQSFMPEALPSITTVKSGGPRRPPAKVIKYLLPGFYMELSFF